MTENSQDAIVGLLTSGIVTDATGDRITGIEVIVGSAHDDTFTVDGTGVHFVGGAGDDTFYLFGSDTAEGGLGVDRFFLSSTHSAPGIPIAPGTVNSVTIKGLGAEDEIYIDGIQYYGNTISVTGYQYEMYGWPAHVDEGFHWYWKVESSSRFVDDHHLTWGYGQLPVIYGALDRQAFHLTSNDQDRFTWTGSDSATIEIRSGNMAYDEDGYFLMDEDWMPVEVVTNQLFINLEDFEAGGGGLSYNNWNTDYHLFAYDDNHRWHIDPTEPYEGSSGPYNPAIIYASFTDPAYVQELWM